MSEIKATNNFVFIIRDEAEREIKGAYIPSKGVEKPHQGLIVSIGGLVRDKLIKAAKNRKAIFHKGIGFEIEYVGKTYLVLQEQEIIAII